MTAVGTALGGLLLLVLLVILLAWVFQRQLIYFPQTGSVPPAAAVLPGAEDVSYRTADGLRLNGWFVPAAGGGRGGATVLVLPGNAGNREHRAPFAAALSRAGLGVLLVDYRGYGDNPGSPSERGLLADARAALAHLQGRDDVDPDRVVYFGESLGAAVALQLAVERPPAALVLRSPFASLSEVGQHHYPLLPVRYLLKDRYDSIQHVRRLRVPLLVAAAEHDSVVPLDQSRRLTDAAREPKRLVVIAGAGHNDAAMFTGRELIGAVVAFVSEHVDGRPGGPGAPSR